MHEECSILWVSGKGTTDPSLRKRLTGVGMKAHLVQSSCEVRQSFESHCRPDVLFCDTSLPDGAWADILGLTKRREEDIPVIIVSQVVNVTLYAHALEMGAADDIVPSFYFRDIAYSLKCSRRTVVTIQKPEVA